MDKYLFQHEKWLQHYNCSFFDIDKIPFEGRYHPVIGSTIFGLAVIFELLYIPCLISINKHAHHPCYNLMRFIGILDVIVMLINGVFTGIGLMKGWVYCSHPQLIYGLGTVVTSLWAVVALASLVLAFNRCVEMFSSELGRSLFGGSKIYIWQVIPIFYGLFFFFFEPPALFSSALCAWFFNPFVLYHEDYVNYVNNGHSFNNLLVTFGLPALYITFFVALAVRTSLIKHTSPQSRSSKKQYGMFLQVFAINVVTLLGCVIYVYMQFFTPNMIIVIIGSFAWLLVHGLPSIIYLTLNKTVRN
ncbi:Serpentine Receptor, class T [Aphelenchoides bicaudatus]|nr:Serpentine Receptor, class T [Aphelenchoides bicaudatus]